MPARSGAPVHTNTSQRASRRLPTQHLSTANAFDDGAPAWMRRAAGYAWRILAIGIVVGLLVYATAKIQAVFMGVFLALVISSVLNPLVNFLNRWIPRVLAVIVSLIGSLAAVGGLVTYVVSSVAGQWDSLSTQFSNGVNELLAAAQQLPFGISISPDQISQLVDEGLAWVQENQANLVSRVFESAGSIFEVFAALALALLCLVFFLLSGSHMWSWCINQLPSSVRERWLIAGEVGWTTFAGYARGTIIIAFIDGVLTVIFLSILKVPLAAPLAVLVFIGAFIPLIGAPLAMVIAMVVALAANGWVAAVIVGIGIAAIGQLEGHVLQPWIMGRQVSLHPVVVAISVLAGTLVAGLLGAVIVIPIVAVMWAIYSALRNLEPQLSEAEITSIKERAHLLRHQSRSSQ